MLKSLIRFVWRFLLVIKRLLAFVLKGSTIALICLMLLFNVATLTLSGLNSVVSAAITSLAGISTVSARKSTGLAQAQARAASLDTELKATKSKLNIETRKSAILAKKYGTAEVAARKLRLVGPDVKFRGKQRSMRSVLDEVSGSVSRRTATVAAANVGSMPGEGIPFWGIAVIVAATTYEMTSACETMKDMRDLKMAIDPNAVTDSGATEVCGMRVPTSEEIWDGIKASPGTVWNKAKETYSDLPSPDFSGWWVSLVSRFTWE